MTDTILKTAKQISYAYTCQNLTFLAPRITTESNRSKYCWLQDYSKKPNTYTYENINNHFQKK